MGGFAAEFLVLFLLILSSMDSTFVGLSLRLGMLGSMREGSSFILNSSKRLAKSETIYGYSEAGWGD
jgi:hypothetical protein